jgi:hypothetical protein
MSGYSGTPLPTKLGVKENFRVQILNMPAAVKTELRTSLASCRISKAGPLDLAMIFAKNAAELKKKLIPIAKLLAPAGMLWVSWPKKASGVATDLYENDVRRIGLEAGLVDVKVCAVNEIWSGLKFVIRVKDRPQPN